MPIGIHEIQLHVIFFLGEIVHEFINLNMVDGIRQSLLMGKNTKLFITFAKYSFNVQDVSP